MPCFVSVLSCAVVGSVCWLEQTRGHAVLSATSARVLNMRIVVIKLVLLAVLDLEKPTAL